RAGRRVLREESLVHLVERPEVADVAEQAEALDGVRERRARGAEDRVDVLKHLPRLLANTPLHDLAGGGIERDLPGHENQVSVANGLGVGEAGPGTLVGADDLALHGAPPRRWKSRGEARRPPVRAPIPLCVRPEI